MPLKIREPYTCERRDFCRLEVSMKKPQIIHLNEKKDLRKVPKKYSEIIGSQQLGKTLNFKTKSNG